MIVLNYSAIFVPAVEEEKVSPLKDIIPIRRRVLNRCAGQQSVTISAERLKDHWRLPIEWDVQQRLLADLVRRARQIASMILGASSPRATT